MKNKNCNALFERGSIALEKILECLVFCDLQTEKLKSFPLEIVNICLPNLI
jgi:hypothetical protein